MLYVHASNWRRKKKNSAIIFFLQHFTSSKLSLKTLKNDLLETNTTQRQTWILTWETPLYHCCTSMYSGNLHSWQTFRAASSSNPHHTHAQGLSFLLTTLGLFSWDFSLLKGKPSVCFYYEMPSITGISGCPRAPSYICQQREESCLWRHTGSSGSLDSHIWPTDAPSCCLCSASIPMTSPSPAVPGSCRCLPA